MRVRCFVVLSLLVAGAATAGETPGLVESAAPEITGEYYVATLDRFSEGTSENHDLLIQTGAEPRVFRLEFDAAGPPSWLHLGDTLTVQLPTASALAASGSLSYDGVLQVSAANLRPAGMPGGLGGLATEPNAIRATSLKGSRRVAVVLMNFQDDTSEPLTMEQADRAFFGSTNSVNAEYREASFGQLGMTGDVYGYYTVPFSSSRCDNVLWTLYLEAAMAQAEIPIFSYQHVAYVLPNNDACDWGGLGLAGGYVKNRWSWTKIYGYQDTIDIAVHELGHNLGLNHARALHCGLDITRPDPEDTCSRDEYGDIYTPMGSGDGEHFNTLNKQYFGWLPSDSIVQAQGPGLFILTGLEEQGTAGTVYSLRLGSSDYYLEYHHGDRGPLIHYWRGTNPFLGYSRHTNLLDGTPGTPSMPDAQLTPGTTFAVPDGGLSVKPILLTPKQVFLIVSNGNDPTVGIH